MIDIDLTVVIQFINFIITLVVLNRLLIRPVRTQIHKRREVLADLESSTAELKARAESAMANYQAAMEGARKEGATFKATLRNEAEIAGQAILTTASNQAHETIRVAAEASAKSIAESRAALYARIPQISKEMLSRLTGTAVKTA